MPDIIVTLLKWEGKWREDDCLQTVYSKHHRHQKKKSLQYSRRQNRIANVVFWPTNTQYPLCTQHSHSSNILLKNKQKYKYKYKERKFHNRIWTLLNRTKNLKCKYNWMYWQNYYHKNKINIIYILSDDSQSFCWILSFFSLY